MKLRPPLQYYHNLVIFELLLILSLLLTFALILAFSNIFKHLKLKEVCIKQDYMNKIQRVWSKCILNMDPTLWVYVYLGRFSEHLVQTDKLQTRK